MAFTNTFPTVSVTEAHPAADTVSNTWAPDVPFVPDELYVTEWGPNPFAPEGDDPSPKLHV